MHLGASGSKFISCWLLRCIIGDRLRVQHRCMARCCLVESRGCYAPGGSWQRPDRRPTFRSRRAI